MPDEERRCENCQTPLTIIGCCIHSGQPVRWCPACGSIRTCDGVECAPVDATTKFPDRTAQEPTPEMIEAAAKEAFAACEEWNKAKGFPSAPWDYHREPFSIAAAAAIAAYRKAIGVQEPTPEVIEAAAKAMAAQYSGNEMFAYVYREFAAIAIKAYRKAIGAA